MKNIWQRTVHFIGADLGITLCLFAICLWVSLLFPQLDYQIMNYFYTPGSWNGFIFFSTKTDYFFDKTLNNILRIILIWGIPLIYILLTIFRINIINQQHRKFWFYISSFAISVGVIINLLKAYIGRARPLDILMFEKGATIYTAPWVISSQCDKNCSFVSGHAGMAFATFALALLTPKQYRAFWVSLSLAFGTLVGMMRIFRGAHFASDVIFAGFIVVITTLLIYKLTFYKKV